jgi:hypothetical protein
VYAFATTFSVAGLTDSDPVYWVLAAGVDEAVHEAAVDYIATSTGIVPEPSSLLLAGSSAIFILLRRRS